jgi:hypothetical protein
MMEMWHYTCEGKQMDPVSIRDLKRLVGDGVVKPTDMVWKEGLPRWIRASSMKELFPDPSSPLDQYFSSPPADTRHEPPGQAPMPAVRANSQAYPDDELRPQRRRRRSADEDDEDRDRPRRRRPAPSGGGYGTQILIASVVGGFVLLAAVVVGIVILARTPPQEPLAIVAPPLEVRDFQPVAPPRADQPKEPVKLAKDDPPLPDGVKTGAGVLPITVRLAPGAEHIVKFRVQADHAAKITVTPLPVPGKVIDLNLQVFKDSDNALVIADETPGASARVEFTLPAAQVVRVRVFNASKKTTVTQFTLVYDVGN